jgi:hypothetical protein
LRDFFLYRDLVIAEATHGKGDCAPCKGVYGTRNGYGLAPS